MEKNALANACELISSKLALPSFSQENKFNTLIKLKAKNLAESGFEATA